MTGTERKLGISVTTHIALPYISESELFSCNADLAKIFIFIQANGLSITKTHELMPLVDI